MRRPTSFSQNNMADKCWRMWFFSYVRKIPTIQDLSYANAGNVLHKTMEYYYTHDVLNDKLKEIFNDLWRKYKLDSAKWNGNEVNLLHNQNMKSQYWLMVINGIELNVSLTTNEMKILADDAVGYIDGVNTNEDIIIDWKSSTRREENEKEYTTQLLFYSYLYYLQFNRLPKTATVYYLKYVGTKGKLSIHPTNDDILKIKKWHRDIRAKQIEIQTKQIVPPKAEKCYMFCPYKDICENYSESLTYNLHLTGNYIKIIGNISLLLLKGLEKKFSYKLKNAHWIKKARPHAKTTVMFYNKYQQTIPIGFLSGLKKTLTDYAVHKQQEISINIDDHRTFNELRVNVPNKFLNGIVLRDYQNDVVETFLKNKMGVLQLATGSGKTEVSIEIIRRLNVKTLFIVDKVELLKQTKKRLEDALGISIGQVGNGEDDLQDITVATVQTLTKHISNYSKYLQTIRLAIFDECHHTSAQSYWKIGQFLLNTEYRLGLSATCRRDDGNDMKITAITGQIIYDLASAKMIDSGWLVKPKVVFINDYMDEKEAMRMEAQAKVGLVGLINETKNYILYYNTFISANTRRNEVIQRVVENNKQKQILVLVKLVEHGNYLESILSDSKYLHGSINKKERKFIFDDFISSKLKILISTISIFAEGIDVPALNMVINASANRGDVKTIQILGRVLRILEGKDNAQYIDFMDITKCFKRASNARKMALTREGHDVEVIQWDNVKI